MFMRYFHKVLFGFLGFIVMVNSARANGVIETFKTPNEYTLKYITRQRPSQIADAVTTSPLIESFTHVIHVQSSQNVQGLGSVWVFSTETFHPDGSLALKQDLYRRIDASSWTEYYPDPKGNAFKPYRLIPLPLHGNSKWNDTLRLPVLGYDNQWSEEFRQRVGEALYWEPVTIRSVPLWCFRISIIETVYNAKYDDAPKEVSHRYWFHKQIGIVKHEAMQGKGRYELTELVEIPAFVELPKEDPKPSVDVHPKTPAKSKH